MRGEILGSDVPTGKEGSSDVLVQTSVFFDVKARNRRRSSSVSSSISKRRRRLVALKSLPRILLMRQKAPQIDS